MELRRVDLNLLVVLDALLRARSVSRAAAALGTSQPATSHALARLRTLLGDPLFVRTSRGIVPTPYAEGLVAPLEAVLDRIRADFLERPRFDPAIARRAFTFGLSDIGELVFLPRILEHVATHAPGIAVRTESVQSADAVEASLRTGETDLVIGNLGEVGSALLYQQRLFGHSHVVVVARDHPAIGATISRAQYVAADHAVVHAGGLTEIDVEAALRRQGIERRVVLTARHYLALPEILRRTKRLVFTVPYAIGAQLASLADVRLLEPPFPAPRATVRQYWHARLHHDPASRWIRGVVAELFLEQRRRARRPRGATAA